MRTALYRLYDVEDVLLYVGVTADLRSRYARHRATKHWWPQVVCRDAEWYPTRQEALDAERSLIKNEKPLYNVQGSVDKDLAEQRRKIHEVAQRAYLLRDRVRKELVDAGLNQREATARAFAAERAYKEESGLYPDGVKYPPASWAELTADAGSPDK